MSWYDNPAGGPPVWREERNPEMTAINWNNRQNVLRLGQLIGSADAIVELANGVPGDATPYETAAYDQAAAEYDELGGDPALTPEEYEELMAAAAELDGMGLANGPDIAGLNPAGVKIYRKLLAKGFPAARALAFARNAQKAKQGQAPQLSNAGEDALELSYQHFLRGFAAEAAEYAAEQGDYDVAAQTAAELGWDGIEMSNGGYQTVHDLANASYGRESQRTAEDATGATWHGSADDRLAAAMTRIATGTYVPRTPSLADFSSPSRHVRELAQARHRQDHQDFSLAGGKSACGTVDDFGRCAEPYHAHGCSAAMDPEITLAMADGDPARLMTDAAGRQWGNAAGGTTTWGEWLEGQTGQRQQVSGWEDGRRDLNTMPRHRLFGDPDDPDDPGQVFPGGTQATVDVIRQQMGVSKEPTGFWRGLEQATRYAAARQTRPPTAAERAYDAWQAAGTAETSRERAARMHRPVQPVQIGETWNGSLPQFAAGMI